MKTPEQKLRHVVEQINGMCWHEIDRTKDMPYCTCGLTAGSTGLQFRCTNPSPSSLEDLIELAEKMGVAITLQYLHGYTMPYQVSVFDGYTETLLKDFIKPAEALLNALYLASNGE
jgi:hypothetical protein